MAQSSKDIYGQMQQAMTGYEGYGTPVTGDITSDLMARVDQFRPQYEELASQEAQAYATPATKMQQYYEQFGPGGGAGPSALSQLSGILGEVGRQYGTADVMSNVLGVSRGRLEQMGQDVAESAEKARRAFLEKYNMLTPLYQTAQTREEAARQRKFQAQQAAKDRALQKSLAAMSRGGGGSGGGSSIVLPSSSSDKSSSSKNKSFNKSSYLSSLKNNVIKSYGGKRPSAGAVMSRAMEYVNRHGVSNYVSQNDIMKLFGINKK